jgi:hypothetical protein
MRSECDILPTGPHVDVAMGMLADFIREEAHRYEKVSPCRPLPGARDAMNSRLRRLGQWRYLPLLIALVVMLASYPYAGKGGALGVAAVLIPITAIRAVATHREHRVIPVVFGLVTLAGIVQEISGVKVIPLLAVAGSALLLFTYTTIFVLRRVLQSERVTGDTLCGAIAVYLMIGLTWSLVYVLVEYLHPRSYRLATAGILQAPGKELLYFSYVTLATLGYGDVVPVTDGARSLAVLESLCGTIYMAILVARLIGLHLSQTGSPR